MILEEAPGIPEEGEISTPETLPCNAPDKLVLAPFVNSSDGTSKLSGEVRKSDKYHFDYAAVEQKGVDADGKPIYVPYTGGVKGSDAEEYFKSVRGIDEAYVYDNSFLKLRELSLSYPVYKKDNLNVNVNVFARNIIVWSEIKGFDPEATQGNNNMAGAFERFSLPGTSSYGFGVNVNF